MFPDFSSLMAQPMGVSFGAPQVAGSLPGMGIGQFSASMPQMGSGGGLGSILGALGGAPQQKDQGQGLGAFHQGDTSGLAALIAQIMGGYF